MKFAAFFALLLVSAAQTIAQQSANDSAATALAEEARAVLRRHCLQCHNGPGSKGGEFDLLEVQQMVENGLIAAGKPDDSYLWERVTKNQMPPREIAERPTAAEQATLRSWIAAGAPVFPKIVARKFVSLESVLTAVRDHLQKSANDDRPFLRFFTLHQLYNNSEILDTDLPIYRAALSKAINSLSRKQRIALPQAIDAAQTLFVVDVRNYDWDRNDGWHELEKVYPYGLSFDRHPSQNLRRLHEDITRLADCQVPVMRVDWFVASATAAPLYYKLLQIPATAKQLESELAVDVKANYEEPKPERIARAGFAKSGVSAQNRLLERHDAKYGFYWKSYDFKPANGRSKLTRFPLGPRSMYPPDKHPFDAHAFVQDGGEMIFSLPNGLQGYMLVDGDDNRIDVGPIDVVNDAASTAGTPAIVNAISCMSCHKNGLIGFKDSIRDRSAVFGDAEDKVRRLYPEQAVLDRLAAEDENRYMTALEKTIGPFVRVGADKDKPLSEFTEPVGEVSRLHRLVRLNFNTVACELDIEQPQEIVSKVGEKKLKQLGLQPLMENKGVINRQEWEAMDGVSLMQELGRELRYTPIRSL